MLKSDMIKQGWQHLMGDIWWGAYANDHIRFVHMCDTEDISPGIVGFNERLKPICCNNCYKAVDFTYELELSSKILMMMCYMRPLNSDTVRDNILPTMTFREVLVLERSRTVRIKGI